MFLLLFPLSPPLRSTSVGLDSRWSLRRRRYVIYYSSCFVCCSCGFVASCSARVLPSIKKIVCLLPSPSVTECGVPQFQQIFLSEAPSFWVSKSPIPQLQNTAALLLRSHLDRKINAFPPPRFSAADRQLWPRECGVFYCGFCVVFVDCGPPLIHPPPLKYVAPQIFASHKHSTQCPARITGISVVCANFANRILCCGSCWVAREMRIVVVAVGGQSIFMCYFIY